MKTLTAILLSSHLLIGHATVLTRDDYSVRIERAVVQGVDDNRAGTLNGMLSEFYYRIGSSGGEHRLESMELVRETIAQGPGLAGAIYQFRNSENSLAATLSLSLLGRDRDGVASFTQTTSWRNLTDSPMDLHVFARTETDLDVTLSIETPSDYDSVQWKAPGEMVVTSPLGAALVATQTFGVAPDAYRITMDTRCFRLKPIGGCEPFALIDELGKLLNDGSPTTLDPMPPSGSVVADIHPPWCGVFGPVVPNNVNCFGRQWAWEWDLSLASAGAAGSSEVFQIENRLSARGLPEPGAMSLFMVSAACAGLARRGASKRRAMSASPHRARTQRPGI